MLLRASVVAGHCWVPLVSPALRQPDSQHVFWQHSDCESAGCQSMLLRALVVAGQYLVPPVFVSPASRHPDSQQLAWQQLASSHTPLEPEHMCPSHSLRALVVAGHWLVAPATLESRHPES